MGIKFGCKDLSLLKLLPVSGCLKKGQITQRKLW